MPDPVKLVSLANLGTFKGYVEEKAIELTAEQYAALPASQKAKDISYYITDAAVAPADLSTLIFSIKQTLTAGNTTLTFTDNRITANSLISIFYPNAQSEVTYTQFEQLANNSFRLTFDEQASDLVVAALVFNV